MLTREDRTADSAWSLSVMEDYNTPPAPEPKALPGAGAWVRNAAVVLAVVVGVVYAMRGVLS